MAAALPRSLRPAVLALKALEAQLASLPPHSPRFHFYQALLAGTAPPEATAHGHPLLDAIRASLALSFAQRRWIADSCAARSAGLAAHLASLQDIDAYASRTVVAALYCQLEYLRSSAQHAPAAPPESIVPLEHAASHLGRAQFTIQRLRALLKGHADANELVPAGLLCKHQVSAELLNRRSDPAAFHALASIAHELATHAHQHLRAMDATVPGASSHAWRLILCEKFCADRFLKALEGVNFDISRSGSSRVLTLGSQRDGWLPLRLALRR